MTLHANEHRLLEPFRHGAYFCLGRSFAPTRDLGVTVAEAADRLGLVNEFSSDGADPPRSIAYLRRVDARPAEVPDAALLDAGAVVHVAAEAMDVVRDFGAVLDECLPRADRRVLDGVVRLPTYTGTAMFNYAYAHRVLQQPGAAMPNAFLVPMNKTPEWWSKDWMERHTYFLPTYDDDGVLRAEGHALSAAAGIACLLRRTYKATTEPASDGSYDFVNYFECSDEDLATFHRVCDALRDQTKNPEWRFVREGPTWHGRRVATWDELFVDRDEVLQSADA